MDTKEKVKEQGVAEPFVLYRQTKWIEVDRIWFEDELIRIDFIAAPGLKYQSGWWISIDRDTFIRPVGSRMKLKMVRAHNITITPIATTFSSGVLIAHYSLFFPRPPKGTEMIDIIEKEFAGGNYFNFYGVAITEVLSHPVFVRIGDNTN